MDLATSDVEAELHHVTVERVVLLALDTDRVLPGPCEVRLNCSLGTGEVVVEGRLAFEGWVVGLG